MNKILQGQREYRGGESIFETNKKGGKGFRISVRVSLHACNMENQVAFFCYLSEYLQRFQN